jgi:hypothetical protein
MQQRIAMLASAATKACLALLNSSREMIAIDVRSYAPEKYYMRGPGPKWREKHAHDGMSAR